MEVVRAMVHCRLSFLAGVKTESITAAAHLDEDAMAAFVEGQLSENETQSIIIHLTSCGSCRDLTARLIRLESSFAADDESTIVEEAPSRLRKFLAGLASQVIPSGGEDAVFAYQNPDENVEKPADPTPDKPKNKA
jgi:anti-sigma factor ChrR (cupin superfamily)